MYNYFYYIFIIILTSKFKVICCVSFIDFLMVDGLFYFHFRSIRSKWKVLNNQKDVKSPWGIFYCVLELYYYSVIEYCSKLVIAQTGKLIKCLIEHRPCPERHSIERERLKQALNYACSATYQAPVYCTYRIIWSNGNLFKQCGCAFIIIH